jgi:hypothetical protein
MKKFTRGYKESREKVLKSAKFTRSCFNCDYYYKTMSDKEEVCQNSNVTQFDLVTEENNIFCCYWRQSSRQSEDSLFKGSGRNRQL